MKHAGPAALDSIEPVLEHLRRLAQIREKKRGIFYRGSSAFLHFHEDPAGIFADLRESASWTRVPVSSAPDRKRLLSLVRKSLQPDGRARVR